MSGERDCRIVCVTQPGVRTSAQDDVYPGELGREQPLVGQHLQVRHQDDLVHALGDQVVDHRLQLRGQQVHVVHFAVGARTGREPAHLCPGGRGDRLEQLRGYTHQADALPTLLQHG